VERRKTGGGGIWGKTFYTGSIGISRGGAPGNHCKEKLKMQRGKKGGEISKKTRGKRRKFGTLAYDAGKFRRRGL